MSLVRPRVCWIFLLAAMPFLEVSRALASPQRDLGFSERVRNDARRELEKLLSQEPSWKRCNRLYQVARTLERQGDHERALVAAEGMKPELRYGAAPGELPYLEHRRRVLIIRALARVGRDTDTRAVLDDMEEASTVVANLPEALLSLGKAYRVFEDEVRLVDAWMRAYELWPESRAAQFLSDYYFTRSRWLEALPWAERAVIQPGGCGLGMQSLARLRNNRILNCERELGIFVSRPGRHGIGSRDRLEWRYVLRRGRTAAGLFDILDDRFPQRPDLQQDTLTVRSLVFTDLLDLGAAAEEFALDNMQRSRWSRALLAVRRNELVLPTLVALIEQSDEQSAEHLYFLRVLGTDAALDALSKFCEYPGVVGSHARLVRYRRPVGGRVAFSVATFEAGSR